MGAALSLFNDFFTHSTGPAYLTGPDAIINDAQLRNYELFDLFGRAKKDVQGGNQIKDAIMFSTTGQSENYKPGDEITVTNSQHLSTITVPWRFTRTPITWTEQEVLLNEGGGAQYHQYKKLKDSKYQAAYTDLLNHIEASVLAAAANNAAMEAANGESPYSLFATVTSDGLAPGGFTTVQGINPSSETKWRNQTASYTAATPFDTDAGIIAGFDELSQLVHFKAPSSSEQYFTSSDMRGMVVVTNKEGRRDYMKAIRANNDITRAGPQDPSYGSPVFGGVPVRFVEAFDENTSFSAGNPDYLFLNFNFFKCVFHRQKWMQKGDVLVFPSKPDTGVCFVDNYWNLFQCSRQRQGYLSAT